jgi:predicted MPP superfamily phosphohydrolase
MSTFAIGDVQGCYKEFRKLLNEINFNTQKDTLWLTGDLVNKGPQSLDVIKYVMDLGDKAITVLGNHDFYLIASYFKADPWPHSINLFDDILSHIVLYTIHENSKVHIIFF